MYGRLCISFLAVSACSSLRSWNILLVITMRQHQQSPNHSAWQPLWEGCPCCPARTLEWLFKDSRNNLFQTARGTALQEPKWVPGTENAAFNGFVLDLSRKEGAFSCPQPGALQECSWSCPSISPWTLIHAKATTSPLQNQAM